MSNVYLVGPLVASGFNVFNRTNILYRNSESVTLRGLFKSGCL